MLCIEVAAHAKKGSGESKCEVGAAQLQHRNLKFEFEPPCLCARIGHLPECCFCSIGSIYRRIYLHACYGQAGANLEKLLGVGRDEKWRTQHGMTDGFGGGIAISYKCCHSQTCRL